MQKRCAIQRANRASTEDSTNAISDAIFATIEYFKRATERVTKFKREKYQDKEKSRCDHHANY